MLLLGHGISNDGVDKYLKAHKIKHDYLEIGEVQNLDYKMIIKSPGIKMDEKIIEKAIEKGIEVITDIELAYRIFKKNIIGITGTNGKTTTATLTSRITNYPACGNIGYSVFEAFSKNNDKYVMELSSFELECIKYFKPHIAIITNLSKSHLDHHKTITDYHMAKLNILTNMDQYDILIYNYDDLLLRKAIYKKEMIKISVSLYEKKDCYIKRNTIYYNDTKIIKLKKIKLIGNHNLYNIMFSIAAAMVSGINKKKIKKEIKNFNGIEYRLQKIGKNIYNDAKSTNVASTIEALKNFKKVILICGGLSRGEKYDDLKPYLKKIKLVLCYGQSKNQIEDFMMKNNKSVLSFDTLEQALSNLKKLKKQATILFSPFHSSLDQFSSYTKRGLMFNNFCIKAKLIKNKKNVKK